jgi:ABC-2 type transport system permease protein
MTADFKAVVWKEWREVLLQHGSVKRWLLNMLLLVGVIGIFMPLQFGRTTVDSLFLLFWIWMPLLNTITMVADSIAGERERHTLETLLASRLTDRAIILGKITVIVAQAWVLMLVSAALAVVTVNSLHREGELIFFPAPVAFGIIFLPLLASLLIAAIGVTASAHATTVRQAYQRMSIPLVAAVMIPSLAMSALPADMLASIYSPEFAQNSLGDIMLVVVLILLFLDVLMLALAFRSFRRPRLLAG